MGNKYLTPAAVKLIEFKAPRVDMPAFLIEVRRARGEWVKYPREFGDRRTASSYQRMRPEVQWRTHGLDNGTFELYARSRQ